MSAPVENPLDQEKEELAGSVAPAPPPKPSTATPTAAGGGKGSRERKSKWGTVRARAALTPRSGATGSLVWVTDDPVELERLCKRPAPGATRRVILPGWDKSMVKLCGNTYRICRSWEHSRSFQVLDHKINGERAPDDEDEQTEMGFELPFDACALVRRGVPPDDDYY